MSNFVADCRALTDIRISGGGTGPSYNHSFNDLNIGADVLDAWYTALPTAAKTITVTDVSGNTAHDPTIATAKTWTVAT